MNWDSTFFDPVQKGRRDKNTEDGHSVQTEPGLVYKQNRTRRRAIKGERMISLVRRLLQHLPVHTCREFSSGHGADAADGYQETKNAPMCLQRKQRGRRKVTLITMLMRGYRRSSSLTFIATMMRGHCDSYDNSYATARGGGGVRNAVTCRHVPRQRGPN